jgi:glycosyltransferase involved in cell wall biosynthesis
MMDRRIFGRVNQDHQVDVSIIAPVYGCSSTVDRLVDEIVHILEDLGKTFEVLLVDDRSPDDVWDRVCHIASQDHRVIGIRLSRNFGRDSAVTAGLEHSCGNVAIMLDADLQDPPTEIPRLLNESEFADIVLTRRQGKFRGRPQQLLSKIYYQVCSLLSGEKFDPRLGGYILLRRKVIDALISLEEVNRNILFVVRWLGFSVQIVDYNRLPRLDGKSSFSIRQRLNAAFNGLMFQSTRFLIIIVFLGLMSALAGMGLGLYVTYGALQNRYVPGWASTIALTLFLFGAVIVVQGVVGVYVGKIFEYSKRRPLYIVDEVLSSTNRHDS